MTYSGDPSSSKRDEVRFLIGDTQTPEFLTDNEIAWCIAEETNTYLSAALACESIASLLAQQIDKSVGDLSVQLSQKYQHYIERGQWLRSRASRKAPAFVTLTANPDRDHYFDTQQFDNYRTW